MVEERATEVCRVLPQGGPLLAEVSELAQAWNGFVPPSPALWPTLLALGEFWEADVLLLKPDPDGEIRLYGGCLCFPSSWRLTDKIGQPIEFIHGPVPGLNTNIGGAIHKFLWWPHMAVFFNPFRDRIGAPASCTATYKRKAGQQVRLFHTRR